MELDELRRAVVKAVRDAFRAIKNQSLVILVIDRSGCARRFRGEAQGGTAMRSAIATAWSDVCQAMKADPSDHSIRVLVVLTDGLDNASKLKREMFKFSRRRHGSRPLSPSRR